jgi:hypothetical protein
MTQAVSLSPRRDGFDPRAVHVRYVVEKVALGQVFFRVLRLSPVNIIPAMLHTHVYLDTAVTRKNGRSLGTFEKGMLCWKSGVFYRNVLSLAV